jgi:hypothetical protein
MLGCIYMIIWRLVRWDARNADWSEQEVWLSLSNNVNQCRQNYVKAVLVLAVLVLIFLLYCTT